MGKSRKLLPEKEGEEKKKPVSPVMFQEKPDILQTALEVFNRKTGFGIEGIG